MKGSTKMQNVQHCIT